MERRSLARIFGDLNAADVRYLVVGGLAVVAHGFLRLTVDLDIVLDLDPSNVQKALNVLTRLKFVPRVPVSLGDFADPVLREKWIAEKHMVVFGLISSEFPRAVIDVFVRSPFDFGAAFERRFVQEMSPGLPISFVSLDLLLEMKRNAGRPKDLEDVRSLERLRDGNDDV